MASLGKHDDKFSASTDLAPGERWRVVQGEALALLAALTDESVDAIVTDPPYSSGGQFRGDRVQSTGAKYVSTGTKTVRPDFAVDNRDQRGFAFWCSMWLTECLRVARPGAPLLVFTDWRQLPTVTDAVQAGGWVWRGVVTWDKTEASRPKEGGFRSQSEFVVWATKGPLDRDAAKAVGYLPGVFRVGVRQTDKFHQTGKPTALLQRLVAVCPPGGVVLDPFAGSGTTLVAALLGGRRALGFEWVRSYAAVARERCAEALGVTPAEITAAGK
jgi:site-specific DNA-methyltransferase (adenine-specific)